MAPVLPDVDAAAAADPSLVGSIALTGASIGLACVYTVVVCARMYYHADYKHIIPLVAIGLGILAVFGLAKVSAALAAFSATGLSLLFGMEVWSEVVGVITAASSVGSTLWKRYVEGVVALERE